MNEIPIPKKFTIFGHTHKVKKLKKVNKGKDYGEWDFNKKTIKLESISSKFSKDQQEEYYLHEVVHGLLESLGYDELSKDEKFVEQFSRGLHQILKTSEY
jgi:ssRNA-specific RNase YbeY (16S rRNA maturation enzyme)